jgi:ketopantoate hydroxymethyltransferase
MQAERVAAYKEYIADVTSGAFPGAAHSVELEGAVLMEALANAMP